MSRLRTAAVIAVGLGIVGALGLMGQPAKADVSSKDLADMCAGKTGNPDIGIAMCNMYIAGLTDMHFYAQYETGQRFYCVKQDGLTSADIRKLFLDWLHLPGS
jgi:hypothetical protein